MTQVYDIREARREIEEYKRLSKRLQAINDRIVLELSQAEAAARINAETIAAQQREIERLNALLNACLVELKHSSIFVRSREKMHPVGIELYDKLLEKLHLQGGF